MAVSRGASHNGGDWKGEELNPFQVNLTSENDPFMCGVRLNYVWLAMEKGPLYVTVTMTHSCVAWLNYVLPLTIEAIEKEKD